MRAPLRRRRAAAAPNVLAAADMHSARGRRLALVLFAAGCLLFRHSIMDDTFIHLQYARNLRAHGEIAFNTGEPSLGATSPLWMLLLAGVGGGERAARLLSLGAGAFAVIAFAALARRRLGAGAWATAATCAWAGSVWLVRHAPNGMETTAGVLLVLVALLLRAGGGRHTVRDVLFGVTLAGAVLVRPEALLLAPLCALQDLRSAATRLRLAAWLPAFVLPILAWAFVAERATGMILPATGAAKSGGIVGNAAVWLRVLGREAQIFVAAHGVEIIGLVLAAVLALRTERRSLLRRLVADPLAPYACFCLLVLGAYAGADVQVQPRYLLFATPCLVLAGFAAWRRLVGGGGGRAAAVVAVASLAWGVVVAWPRVYPATRDFAIGVEAVLRPMAKAAEQHATPGAVVAAPDIGIMGYESGLRVLDLGGLVEPRMQAIVTAHGYDEMLRGGHFLDLGRVDFVLDRSTERERFQGHVTHGLMWRALRTGAVRGLGISRPETYHYTLYALEPESAFGTNGNREERSTAWVAFGGATYR